MKETSLQNNQLSGTIPTEVGEMVALGYLYEKQKCRIVNYEMIVIANLVVLFAFIATCTEIVSLVMFLTHLALQARVFLPIDRTFCRLRNSIASIAR